MSETLRDSLSITSHRRAVDACDRFEAAFRAGDGPNVDDFLAEADSQSRSALLEMLHALEADLRRAGEPPAGYELLDELGRGGMGVIYRARQRGTNRLIAVKVLRPEYASGEASARFAAEARIAELEHEHIVPIYEAGSTNGRLFIAMRLIEGPSLAAALRVGPFEPLRAARILAAVARAIAFAHAHGVLHRDLKPSNILLDAEGKPYVADFGLARRLDATHGLTQTGALLGTPAYMAPEQVTGEADQRSDVYSLGATLYEMLTGRPPFMAAEPVEVLRQARDEEPLPLRRLRANVPADLEAVCLKCLEKEPARRYSSAAALADELQRFIHGEPTWARPARLVERMYRWARRHPDLAGLTALTAFAMFGAIAVGVWLSVYLAVSRAETRAAEQMAGTQEYYALIERVRQRRAEPHSGWTELNLADLGKAAQLVPASEHRPELRSEVAAALTGVDLKLRRKLSPPGFDVYNVVFSPDSNLLALGGWAPVDGVCQVWLVDAVDGRVVRKLTYDPDRAETARSGKNDGCRDLVFSPDGRWLVAASNLGGLHRWDLRQQADAAVSWKVAGGAGQRLAFGTARPVLFFTNHVKLLGWDADDGWKEVVREGPTSGVSVDPSTGFVAFSKDYAFHLWDGQTLQPRRPPGPNGGTITLSPDGHTAAIHQGGSIWLGHALLCHGYRPLAAPQLMGADSEGISDIRFSPDGALLASASEFSRHVRLWDVVGNRLVADRVAGASGSMRLSFHPNGRTLVVAAGRSAVEYEIVGRDVQPAAANQEAAIFAAALGADGRSLVCLGGMEATNMINVFTSWWPDGFDRNMFPLPQTHDDKADFSRGRPTVAVDPLGRGVVYSKCNALVYWPSPLVPKLEAHAINEVKQVNFAPDGRLWVAAGLDVIAFTLPGWRESARWADGPTDRQAGRTYYTVAPGASHVLVGRRDGQIFALDPTARHLATWRLGDMPVSALALDEGTGVAIAADERGQVRLFRVPDGEVLVDLPQAHTDKVGAAAIAPGGSLFATGGHDNTIRLWQRDGSSLLTLRTTAPVAMLAFTPDGLELISLAAGERGVRRWHLGRLRQELRVLGLDW